jgi:hypothetical protein
MPVPLIFREALAGAPTLHNLQPPVGAAYPTSFPLGKYDQCTLEYMFAAVLQWYLAYAQGFAPPFSTK